MKRRCNNKNHDTYRHYGGRGIEVCDRWQSFEAFLADMGERPPWTSLDRYPDPDGDYEPGNCRWATRREQARNKRTSRIIEFNGKSQCLKAWAEELGINQSTLFERLQKWPIERALTERSRYDRREIRT